MATKSEIRKAKKLGMSVEAYLEALNKKTAADKAAAKKKTAAEKKAAAAKAAADKAAAVEKEAADKAAAAKAAVAAKAEAEAKKAEARKVEIFERDGNFAMSCGLYVQSTYSKKKNTNNPKTWIELLEEVQKVHGGVIEGETLTITKKRDVKIVCSKWAYNKGLVIYIQGMRYDSLELSKVIVEGGMFDYSDRSGF